VNGELGYLDGVFASALRTSAWGLRKVEVTAAGFLDALSFLASRLARCLSPFPMIVHSAVVYWRGPPSVEPAVGWCSVYPVGLRRGQTRPALVSQFETWG